MGAHVVDPMNDAPQWTVLAADGATPSNALTATTDTLDTGYGADGTCVRLQGTGVATGHMVRRTLPAVDLTGFTELRLSIKASRAAQPDGPPFFLQLRLGSVSQPLTAATNTWHRLLPISAPNRWETVKLGIDDLPGAIRGAMTAIEFRCLALDSAFLSRIDDLTVVRPEMLADADRALQDRLAGITVAGTPALAKVRSAGQPAPNGTALDITQLDLAHAPIRMRERVEPRDYTTGGGVRLIPPGEPYDVTYTVTPVAATRAAQATLLEQVVHRLAPLDELVVDGDRLPVELVRIGPRERVGGAPGPDPVLFYRVGARAWRAPATGTSAVSEIVIETDRLEVA